MIPPEEQRHLQTGARREERPGGAGLVRLTARSHGDAPAVLARAREVMAAILDGAGPPWPPAESWRRKLPSWFVEVSGPERSQEEVEQWLRWWRSLPPGEQARAAQDQQWALADWLFWMEPSERQWFWWDASVDGPDAATVVVEVPGWPAPLGALEWLLRAAGAIEVVRDAPATA